MNCLVDLKHLDDILSNAFNGDKYGPVCIKNAKDRFEELMASDEEDIFVHYMLPKNRDGKPFQAYWKLGVHNKLDDNLDVTGKFIIIQDRELDSRYMEEILKELGIKPIEIW